MSYSKTLSALPDFQEFYPPDDRAESTTVTRCAGQAIIGNRQSPDTIWTATIVGSQLVLTNDFNQSSVSYPIPVGAINPAACFDLDNRPIISVEFSGNVFVFGTQCKVKKLGVVKTVTGDNLSAISLPGSHPKLIVKRATGTYIVQLFYIQPINGESYLSVIDLSEIGRLSNCTPSGVPVTLRIPSAGVAGNSSNYSVETGILDGSGTPFTDTDGLPKVYNLVSFPTPTIFYTHIYTGAIDGRAPTDPNTRIFVAYGENSETAVAEFIEFDTMVPGVIYLILNLQDNTMDYFDEVSQIWRGVNLLDTESFYVGVNDDVFYPPASTDFLQFPVGTDLTNNTLSVAVFPMTGPFTAGHHIVVSNISNETNLSVSAGDQIDLTVNGIDFTFTMPFDDAVEFALFEIMSEINRQLQLDTNYQYFLIDIEQPRQLQGEWGGIDLNDFTDVVGVRLNVTLNMATASQSFKDAFGAQSGTLQFHSCGGIGFPDSPGPGPGQA